MVKNYGDNENGYDVGIVIRVVESYVTFVSNIPTSKICAVGRLIGGYLMLVARDENLSSKIFQSLAEGMPKDCRYCDNNLYRAIIIYLKVWKFFRS